MRVLATALLLVASLPAAAQNDANSATGAHQTYANPLNLPYRFQPAAPSRREAADPTMVVFHNEYWLFASKSGGYWHSPDLQHWQLVVPTGLPLEDYAPTAVVLRDHLYFTAYNTKAIFTTDDPAVGHWRKVADIPAFGDPDLFLDDDGRLYMYAGCSSKTPLNVTELDPKNFHVLRQADIEIARDPDHRGFEVPGEHNEKIGSPDWVEGSWMTKHDGKYYLQYAAPGTHYKTYADGLVIADSPMGPFHYAPNSPMSYKPSGFVAGAGHGSTFQDLGGHWWHIASMTVSVRHPYERRLGLFPVIFASDGAMSTDTYLGDYPHYLPSTRRPAEPGALAGWMLLSLNKPATASSSLPNHDPARAFDEEIRDWWSAATGNPGEWLAVDLGSVDTVHATQINFADEGATTLGRTQEVYLYKLEGSSDNRHWTTLVDHTRQGEDAPNDYEELRSPAKVRYLRLTNQHTIGGAKFSVSGLRVFGTHTGAHPQPVTTITARRDPQDARHATIAWQPSADAQFYIVRFGDNPHHLDKNFQVYNATTLDLRSLNTGIPYTFTVDAVNESSITTSAVLAAVP